MTTPWILALSAILFTVSYGLHRRTRWMWHGGWIVFYFVAGGIGDLFFDALLTATDQRSYTYAWIYFGGGLVLWWPAVIYWARAKAQFETKPTQKITLPPPQNTAAPDSPAPPAV